MAWTQATPNGGNSQLTGNRNKNNNASANRQTANYGSGNSNTSSSSSSSGDPRGNEGNNYTNYLTPAPKAPTPVYPSPNEQGQGAVAPVAPVTVTPIPQNDITSTPAPTAPTAQTAPTYDDDWIKNWIDDQATKNSGYEESVVLNTQAIKDQNKDYGEQFLNINDAIDTTNNTVGDLNLNYDNQQKELYQLNDVAKNNGLQLVDQDGQIVDLERDVISNAKVMQQGQNADLRARTSRDNEVNRALESVDYQFGDASRARSEFQLETGTSFQDTDNTIEELQGDLGELGVDIDNVVGTAENAAENAEIARENLRLGIAKETGNQIILIEDYVNEVENNNLTASSEIIDLIEKYDAAVKADIKKGELRQNQLKAEGNALNKSLQLNEERTYGQDYWADRLRTLQADPETTDQARSIIKAERDALGDKAYSGDIVVDAQDQFQAKENLMAVLSQIGGKDILGASPAAPPEYIFEQTMNNIDKWVTDGKATVEETVSGIFDENTQKVYTLENGDVLTRKSTSPVINDEDGEEMIRLGEDTDQLFYNGVEIGKKTGDVTTVPKEGEANHVDSRNNFGDDDNPNSPANRPDEGNGNGNGQSGNNDGQSGADTPAETDPVVGEDIPLPNDLTDPNGAGAYGQDGNAFTLDGVTFWKRIKDRNGRWTYTRMDSFENQGTTARRQDWGQNVQNFQDIIMAAWGTLLNMGSTLLGASEAYNSGQASRAATAEQMAMQREMLEMAKLREGYDIDMRNKQRDSMEAYQATLKDVFNRLGARDPINAQTIQNDTNTYLDQNMYDLNQTLDRVNSQGYAGASSRGMLNSSVEDDRKRELTGKFYGLTQKARTDAETRAMAKASDYEDLFNTNRTNITSEYDEFYQKPFDMAGATRKSDGYGPLNAAGNMADSVSQGASDYRTIAQGAFGKELQNLRENDWDFSKYNRPKDKE